MIVADRQFDGQAAIEAELRAVPAQRILDTYASLRQQAVAALGEQGSSRRIDVTYRADCRYAGQPAAITVDVHADLAAAGGQALADHIQQAFERNHKRMWNFIKPDQPVVLVNLRVQANVPTGWRGVVRQAAAGKTSPQGGSRRQRTRDVYIDGKMQALPVYRRADLDADLRVEGPAIIEEQSSCLIFKAGQTARVDPVGNLRIAL
jgi:N-methylhydantoinase A